MITACFTGRRPKYLCGYDQTKYAEFVPALSKKLEEFCESVRDKKQDHVRFLFGGAQGFDQLAFWAVYRLRERRPDLAIATVVYVPFRGQEKEWKEDGLFGQRQYLAMLQHANSVKFLKEDVPKSKELVVKALMERNHAMVDKSSHVFALYAGNDWKEQKGGTCECMRYAYDQKKCILQINYSVTSEGMFMPAKWTVIAPSKETAPSA